MKKWMVLGALAMAGCCFFGEGEKNGVTAVSPDGKNEIRLWTSPLAYEVRRGGTVVVAKSEIGMKVGGRCLVPCAACSVQKERKSGFLETPVYKKARVDLSGNETFVDFGDWGVRLAARNDGVAYRFETKFPGKVTVDCEKAGIALDDSTVAYVNFSDSGYNGDQFQCSWETVNKTQTTAERGRVWHQRYNDGKTRLIDNILI